VSEKPGQLAAEVSEKFGHTSDRACPKNPDITSLTTWGARAGSGLGAGEPGNDESEPAVEDGTGPSHEHPVSVLPKKGSGR
jgi:hypothetical protein